MSFASRLRPVCLYFIYKDMVALTCPELVQVQHDALVLLQAMYPRDSELVFPSLASRDFLDSPSTSTAPHIPLELNIALDNTQEPTIDNRITLEIALSLIRATPTVVVALAPSKLSRVEHEKIRGAIRPIDAEEGSSEYIMEVISCVEGQVALIEPDPEKLAGVGEDVQVGKKVEKLERVWFWFPSLSSKEKRKDLVTFAHDVGLTGFVLAGKPGLLCVEGDGGEVDTYMGRIKSESWSDIPSYQKKVTERLRNSLNSPSDRLLPRMVDITDQISHYGQYAHRPEMGEVKRQMQIWGVEEEWGQVVMGPGSGG